MGKYAIVGRCAERPPVAGLPDVHIAVAVGPRRGPDGNRLRAHVSGTGVATDPTRAWLQAVIEAVERYCLVWPRADTRIVRASFDEVGAHALPWARFPVFADDQYRTVPDLQQVRHTEEIGWAWAYSLTIDRWALIPAVFAFPFAPQMGCAGLAHVASSTGAACHVATDEALLAGLFEVIERDAIMLHWLNRRSPRRIRVSERRSPEFARWSGRHFDVKDLEFVLLDLTCDSGIPTVACLALGDGDAWPAAVLGAATRADPADAARKALCETVQILAALEAHDWRTQPPLAATDVRTFEDHARFYARADAAKHLRFLTATRDEVDLADIPAMPSADARELLDTAVSRLAGLDLEVLAVDVTTPDVAQCGLRAVKVVVPGMVDINADARVPHMGSHRIRTASQRLGWGPVDAAAYNTAPCPLP